MDVLTEMAGVFALLFSVMALVPIRLFVFDNALIAIVLALPGIVGSTFFYIQFVLGIKEERKLKRR